MRLCTEDVPLSFSLSDVDKCLFKSRAIIENEEGRVIVCNYNGVYMFPGGSVEENEYSHDALIRELYEELGVLYHDIKYFDLLIHYQKDYPTIEGNVINRIVETHYYICEDKGFDITKQKLTESEKKAKFKVEFVSLDEIEELLRNNKTDNPRNVFFNEEMMCVVEAYKKYKERIKLTLK